MRRTRLYTIGSGLTTGGAGVSTVTAYSNDIIRGEVMGIFVKYYDTPPATTDVTISSTGTDGVPTQTILQLLNANTDVMKYPRVQVCDTAGSAISGEYTPIIVHDRVKVVVAQANDGDSVEVWLLIRD